MLEPKRVVGVPGGSRMPELKRVVTDGGEQGGGTQEGGGGTPGKQDAGAEEGGGGTGGSRVPELKRVVEALMPMACRQDVNYERLETLGDAFLKYAASLYAFTAFPRAHEGTDLPSPSLLPFPTEAYLLPQVGRQPVCSYRLSSLPQRYRSPLLPLPPLPTEAYLLP